MRTPVIGIAVATDSSDRIRRGAAAIVILMGVLVLIGWRVGSDLLTRGWPGLIPMIPLTAVGFITGGLALALLGERAGRTPRRAGLALAGGLTLLGVTILAERTFGWNAGIDLILFPNAVRALPWLPPGRPAINSGFNFTVMGLALLLTNRATRRGRRPAEALAAFTVAVSFLAIVGYLYGVREFYSFSRFSGMALITAVGFALLGTGVLFARPRAGTMPVFVRGASSVLARRLLPSAVLLPVLLGWIWLSARRTELVTREVGVSVFVLIVVIVFVALVVRTADVVNRLGEERERLLVREQAARADAEAANRAKSEFLAAMSHELRTPLNAIVGYAELMEMGIHGPVTPAQQENLQRIRRSQRVLLALVNDVLNFAKLESGRLQYVIEDVPAHELVTGIEALVLPQLDAKRLSYELTCSEGDTIVRADHEKVRQIILNLLTNSIKFTEPGGRVTLSCHARDRAVLLRVVDSGIGIPADKLEAIFEPFVQVDRALTRSHGGAGLGLAISRDLARAMGGEVSVQSVLGEGSVFTLSLPRGASLSESVDRPSGESVNRKTPATASPDLTRVH
ncbi:MAG: HAMP domain-containing sensor histidine kinase [Gemmatimonadaceae bacterium]